MQRPAISLRRSLTNLLRHRHHQHNHHSHPPAVEAIVQGQFWNLNGRFKVEREIGCGNYSTGSSCTHVRYSSYRELTENKKNNEEVDRRHMNDQEPPEKRIGRNISSVEKRKFLVNTLMDLKDSKEAVYGTLDAWVAWENNFPLVTLKKALIVLEKEEQWHRVVQVIKWMLSKGQGQTMGTYEQLIRALEKDNRAEEAHIIWKEKISHDLHSVPWTFCDLMLSIYYRNNMLNRLVKLFQGLESFDRKPPTKSIIRKVGDAYEVLGLLEEKDKLFAKYESLLNEPSNEGSRKSKKSKKCFEKKSDKKACGVAGISEDVQGESKPPSSIESGA